MASQCQRKESYRTLYKVACVTCAKVGHVDVLGLGGSCGKEKICNKCQCSNGYKIVTSKDLSMHSLKLVPIIAFWQVPLFIENDSGLLSSLA